MKEFEYPRNNTTCVKWSKERLKDNRLQDVILEKQWCDIMKKLVNKEEFNSKMLWNFESIKLLQFEGYRHEGQI